jgi:hypothetical protein
MNVMGRSSFSRSAPLAGALVVALVGSGCARLVNLSPQEVNASNDVTWKVRKAPAPVEPIMPAAGPIPMRERPEVQRALQTPPDSLGIPAGLYAADPILTAHREDMRAESSARTQVGTALVIFGLAFGGLAAWAISAGAEKSNSTDQDTQKAGSQLVVSGGIIGFLAVGELIAGAVMLFESPNAAPLTGYYRETYTDRR